MILSLALLLPMLAMGADDAEILNALRLHKASGEEVTILLKERPVVTFVSNDLVVTTQSNEVSYPSADIMKFTYEAVEYSGVNGLAQTGSLISFLGDELQVAHLTSATEVAVYTLDGKCVATATTDAKGAASISLSGQPAAVYVVKTSSVTFKIHKQ